MSHATPQDTIAALRTRISRELAFAEEHGFPPNHQTIRDARLKLTLLDQVEGWLQPQIGWVLAGEFRAALSLLRLLAESAGEAVAW